MRKMKLVKESHNIMIALEPVKQLAYKSLIKKERQGLFNYLIMLIRQGSWLINDVSFVSCLALLL